MKKFFAWILTITTLFTSNSGFISLVHAQEATESAIIEVSPTPEPTPAVSVSDWQQTDENTDRTLLTVAEGKEYSFRDTKVKVKFTKITTPGYLTIKQIKLSSDEQKKLHSLSDTAYDITSDMPDGSFLYDLTLPKPSGKANVQYSEDGKEYTKVDSQDNNDVLFIKDLNHFTIFIVTDDDASYVGAPNPWIIWGVGGYSGSGFHYAPDTQADQTATWTFSSITPGSYKVYISWSTHSNRTTSAPYTLNYDGGSLSKNINQEQLSDQSTAGADNEWSGWYDYGTFNLNTSSNLVLKTVDNTSGTDYVVADEIRLVSVPDTTYVDDDYTSLGTNDGHTWGYDAFSAIQEGVDGVTDGGTVNVKDGLYTSPVVIDKKVDIVGSGSNTIINTGNTNIGISLISGANGVTIKNCKITGNGDGINADGISNLTLQDLIIDNNSFATSGAYLSNVATVNITGTTFSNNIVGLDLVGTTSDVTVTSSTFTNNSSYDISNATVNDAMAVGNTWDQVSGYYSPKVLENTGLVIYDQTAPAVPTGITPADNTFITTANLTNISWNAVTDDYSPVTYIYEAISAYTSGDLTTNSILTPGTPEGVYNVHVKAKDALGNTSAWSAPVRITVDNTAPIITVDPYSTAWTNSDITVTVSTNEGTLNTNTHTFTANGSFDFIATDAAGNSTTQTVTISNIDKGNPTNPGTPAPDVTTPTDITTINWTWTAASDALSGVKQYIWNLWNSTVSVLSGTTTTLGVTTSSLSDEVYTLKVKAEDNAGNFSSQASSSAVTVDTVAPAVPNLLSPIDGYVTKGVAFSQTWSSVSDAVLYKYESCNVDPGDLGAACTNVKFTSTYTGTTKSVAAGQPNSHFWWRVMAKDAAGNWSAWSASREFIIDNTTPVLSSKTTYLSTWYTVDQTSTFNYIDNESSIVSGTPVTCSITTEGSSQTCSVTPNVCDAAGNCNTTTATSNAIKLDKTKPTSQVSSPTYDNAETIPVDFTASDPVSGVANVSLWYRFNSGSWTDSGMSSASTSGTFNFDPVGVDGTYEFYSITTDVAGNVEIKSAADDSTIYDDTNPTGTWVAPAVNTTISGSTNLVINTNDSLSGVDTVVYKYAPDGSSTFTVIPGAVWDTTPLALGKYTLRAVITDKAGNVYNADESVYVAAVITSFTHYTVDTNRIQIDWTTDRLTDGRVIYDIVSNPTINSSAFPNYGYAYSTGVVHIDPNYATSHSITLTGLADNTPYYFRVVSAGTPIVISEQTSNRTFTVSGAGGGGGGGGGSNGGTSAVSTPLATTPPAPAAVQGQVAGVETEEPVVEEILLTPTPSPVPSPTPTVEGSSTELPSFNWWLVIVPSFLFLLLMLLWLARRSRS